MRVKTSVPPALLLALLILATPPSQVTAHGRHDPHYNGQYSMEVGALMGPDGAELVINFATSDSENFPLPDELEKLKVKVHQRRHGHGHGHGNLYNERHVALQDGQLVLALQDAPLYVRLKVEATLDAGRRDVKLTEHVWITLRPDLTIESVGFPATVHVGQPFNIDVNLEELLGDNGALASVNLNTDALSLTTPEVHVAPQVPATVVFAGLSFNNPGMVTFTASISDADPAEYDLGNNSFSFDIEVLPVRSIGSTEYFMTYNNFNNISEGFWTDQCGDLDETEYSGDHDDFYIDGNSLDASPSGAIDISFNLVADGVPAYTLEVEGLLPYQVVNGLEFYEFEDEVSAIHVFYARDPDMIAYFTIQRYSGMEIYINYLNGDIVYSNSVEYGPHMDARSNIQAAVLIDDGTYSIGGTASMDLDSPIIVNDSFSYTFNDPFCGPYTYAGYSNSEYIYGESFGIMDPSFMAKRKSAAPEETLLPETFALSDNYPNPFNPSTTISVALPEAARISLTVYDIQGRQVLTLARGLYPAGYQEFRVDASQLSSGSYIYVLQTGDLRQVKRMLLLK